MYESIAALLYGMNSKKQIDWAAAQETALNADGEDSVIKGFIALFLHPDIFPSSVLEKNESMALNEWAKAEEIGLSDLVIAGNAWAQWVKGMFLDMVEEKYDSAKNLYQLAAEQDHALAQYSLGTLYHDDEQFDVAEDYYELAAGQGHADAQYNLAVMFFDGKDFGVKRPYLEKAALQGHKEAQLLLRKLFSGGTFRTGDDLEKSESPQAEVEVVVSEVNMDRRAQLTSPMKELLTCPISGELMSDPVTLVPSGISYDRKSLCDYLLKNPSKDPSTDKDHGDKLQYAENYSARQVLTLYLGDEAFQKYNDSVFKLQYKSLWNVQVYESIAALLYGMNSKQIDWAAAQETALSADGEDSVIKGFIALFLHPDIFPSSRLEKNESKALCEWAKAEDIGLSDLVSAGNAWAQWVKGMFLDMVEDKYDSAKNLYQLAAEQDHALAQCSLGELYDDDEQYDMAEYYCELAAGQGHALAQYNLAVMLFDGGDFDIMKPYLEKAAVQGHEDALYYLESVYGGIGGITEDDLEKSEPAHEVAMEEENAHAQFRFDQLYFDGFDEDLENQKARFEVAAEQGHVEALFNLGIMYEEDDQFDIAEEYYERAADQGHTSARYNLAMLYEPDFESSRPHFEQAAAQGHVEALFYLGCSYVSSDIVERDYEKARYYLEQAAKQGHEDSQLILYILYRDGLGVEQDMEKAKCYFDVAFQSG